MSEVNLRIPDYFPDEFASAVEMAEAVKTIRDLPFGDAGGAGIFAAQNDRGLIWAFRSVDESYIKIHDWCETGTKSVLIEFKTQIGVHVRRGSIARNILDGPPGTIEEEIIDGMTEGTYLTDLILESDNPESEYFQGSFYDLVWPPSSGRLKDVMNCLISGEVIYDIERSDEASRQRLIEFLHPELNETGQ